MVFFPSDQSVIRTHLSPDRVRQNLFDSIEPKPFPWTYPPDHKPFQGSLQENRFEIQRIVHNRNSFGPIMKGEIRRGEGETVVDATTMPQILTILYMTFSLGFAACVFLVLLRAWIFSFGTFHIPPAIAILIPAGMFAWGYASFTRTFKSEARQLVSSLTELLEAYQE